MNEENNGQLSQEEVKARRAEITKFYKDQIPHLKVQAEYERLMTEIEENRAKRMQAQAFLANAYMEIEGAKDDPHQQIQCETIAPSARRGRYHDCRRF